MMESRSDSPFGIYSPYGEFGLDRSTFATPDEISGHLHDLGVGWVQELPPYLAIDMVPADIGLYSRVGREAGMVPPLIHNPDAVWNFQQELTRTISSGIDRFQYLEVDTEPDGLGGWQNDPAGYVQLMRLSHEIIKKISPTCKIMFGGLSGGQRILDDQGTIFLEKAMAAGAAEFMDGIAFKRHHLGVESYAAMKTHYETIGRILAPYGLDIHAIPVFVEAAMYDGDPNDPVAHPLVHNLPVQTEAEQAAGLLRTYIYALSLGIQKIFWNLIYERSDYEPGHATPFPQNPFNHYGLIHNPTNADGLSHKKLAYYTYKKMVEMLNGSDWTNIQSNHAGAVSLYQFMGNGKTTYVAWWDHFHDPAYLPGATRQVVLSDLRAASARVIEAIPDGEAGDQVMELAPAFKEREIATHDATLVLTLEKTPLYIELAEA